MRKLGGVGDQTAFCLLIKTLQAWGRMKCFQSLSAIEGLSLRGKVQTAHSRLSATGGTPTAAPDRPPQEGAVGGAKWMSATSIRVQRRPLSLFYKRGRNGKSNFKGAGKKNCILVFGCDSRPKEPWNRRAGQVTKVTFIPTVNRLMYSGGKKSQFIKMKQNHEPVFGSQYYAWINAGRKN